ncbi:MAG: isoamylase [SAR324 cluster bacterium]|nr:isoamylase [SAR324 cluster bacterium]
MGNLKGLTAKRGKAYPLGATKSGFGPNNSGVNFAIYAPAATQLFLVIEKGGEKFDLELVKYKNQTGQVWHVDIQNITAPFSYYYQIQQEDQAFDFIIDPYAPALTGLEKWGAKKNYCFRGYYQEHDFDWGDDQPPAHTSSKSIIYELHLRGFTKDLSSKTKHSGTYDGVIEKIPYLQELGVTAIEIMPIHEFDETDNPFKSPKTGEKLVNYWGYANLNFFAPKAAYAKDPEESKGVNDFKRMVKALHKADIEVILDVVFNHTAEGGEDWKTFNFKALAPHEYYIYDKKGQMANYSGCGNTLNCNHPVTRKMILDSLVYWVVEMHIDGFRFDLASILSRDEKGEVLTNPPLLEAIAKHPVLSGSKIIAEAWDAQGLYQVGSFPASHKRWAEWNGRFRDAIRLFAKGTSGIAGEVATRLAGSEDLYSHSQRNPFHSINFITSHDGFTMADLVSFEGKHNFQNGENNQDGTNDNHSINFGIEGKTNESVIVNLRQQQQRNLACFLLLSQGTPMILSGDEFGNSQGGNNNTWCQDNETGWLNWSEKEKNPELFLFWKRLIAFRKDHALFQRKEFYTGEVNPNSHIPDISWHGSEPSDPRFDKDVLHFAMLIDGMRGDTVIGPCLYMAMNFSKSDKEFRLPEINRSNPWQRVLDTAEPKAFLNETREVIEEGRIQLPPFSIQVLQASY